ncbi:MAG: hypothetical protein EOP83_10270 [Verrucomicrobiaceae bacterium]|nr:MAG: hypothetical protein EOP83_10270 [Verrucomicrobiaceae bacterium]
MNIRRFKYVDPPPEIAAMDFTGLFEAIPRAHESHPTHQGQLRRWKVWVSDIWVIADHRYPWTRRIYTSTWAVRAPVTGQFRASSFGGSVDNCLRECMILRVFLYSFRGAQPCD